MNNKSRGSIGQGVFVAIIVSIFIGWIPIIGSFIVGTIAGLIARGAGRGLIAGFITGIINAVLLGFIITALGGFIGGLSGLAISGLIGAGISFLVLVVNAVQIIACTFGGIIGGALRSQ